MSNKQIEQKYAKETALLNPPHRFVPWVVVNNQALQEVFFFFCELCDVIDILKIPISNPKVNCG